MGSSLNPKRTVAELKELRALTGDENGAQWVAFTPHLAGHGCSRFEQPIPRKDIRPKDEIFVRAVLPWLSRRGLVSPEATRARIK